jgi:hypothetical protein
MGLKLGGGLLKCGTCGKQRGIRHTCVTRMDSRRLKTRTRVQLRVSATCTTCGRKRGIRHACRPKSDFKARKRKQATAERRQKRKAVTARRTARRKQVAADRRAREKARKAAAKKRKPRSRPRGDSHEPGTCGDRDCPKYGCKNYWAGMDDCPLPHNG